jgi:hypothetical protein
MCAGLQNPAKAGFFFGAPVTSTAMVSITTQPRQCRSEHNRRDAINDWLPSAGLISQLINAQQIKEFELTG